MSHWLITVMGRCATYELCNTHVAQTTIPDNDSSVEIHSILSAEPGFSSKSSNRAVLQLWELTQIEFGFPTDVDDENY